MNYKFVTGCSMNKIVLKLSLCTHTHLYKASAKLHKEKFLAFSVTVGNTGLV